MKYFFAILFSLFVSVIIAQEEDNWADGTDFKPVINKTNIFKFREYSFTVFDKIKILKFLFPGKLYIHKNKDDKDPKWNNPAERLKNTYTCWSSNQEPIYFPDNGMDNTHFFPMKNNCTFILGDLKSNQYRFLFFNTNENFWGTRFDGGYLGCAKFLYKNGNYTLEQFNPAIEAIGDWGFAPMPQKIINLGKENYGFVVIDKGEGMGVEEYNPLSGNMYIYAEVNGKIKKVLYIQGSEFEDPFVHKATNWNSAAEVTNNFTNGYKDLKLTITGFYDNEYFPDPEFISISEIAKFIKANKGKESHKFKITKTYKFFINEYVPANVSKEEYLKIIARNIFNWLLKYPVFFYPNK